MTLYNYFIRHTTSIIVRLPYNKCTWEEVLNEMIEISSDVIRGYNDTIILYILLDEPSYGYEISKRIRALSSDKYIIKETTLYSAFTRMEKNGYIESYSQYAENGKKRTYYKITENGKKYYKEKCEEWNLTKEVIERFVTKI